jgi:hypothetical protein
MIDFHSCTQPAIVVRLQREAHPYCIVSSAAGGLLWAQPNFLAYIMSAHLVTPPDTGRRTRNTVFGYCSTCRSSTDYSTLLIPRAGIYLLILTKIAIRAHRPIVNI